MPFNRYKKTANNRRNAYRRWSRWHPSRRKPLLGIHKMDVWVALPVSPTDNERGDLDAQPSMEVELRKQEADHTNYFLIHNNQSIRYEKKSDWLKNKWEKRLKKG